MKLEVEPLPPYGASVSLVLSIKKQINLHVLGIDTNHTLVPFRD